ncbi:transcriptional regulator, TetR family [Tistlia consotensis]|uniref:Transcriptional regulator, TetR family n=1 Tax=Tistlia consotensis USBA 355 TaxID=560819 RepID=A0A1Y6BGY6_9PROT|nr:TetR/AcrR family transcriptional regulator [Tistlia consotensis]SMF03412.1 transcriptional regulator, TetR family [Tistlia consotensis USBA 355]SNR53666.1 transcriptional regulator, TetR family [Tistlia consotensis]
MVQKKQDAEPRRRGRPPAYDPRTALGRVTEAFWSAGYAGTPLAEICAATGMNKPSLYAAFGDKHALYLAALEQYWQSTLAAMRGRLAEDRPLRDRLMRVYEDALTIYFSGDGSPRGCFVIGTAVTEALGDRDVRDSLAAGLRTLDRDFEACFRAAQEHGELGGDADPAALAVLAIATLQTIAVRARAGASRASLRKLAGKAVGAICGSRGAAE